MCIQQLNINVNILEERDIQDVPIHLRGGGTFMPVHLTIYILEDRNIDDMPFTPERGWNI